MDLSLRRLRTLREVAHHGGVNAAAAAMHYSPSAISQQMAALEEEVGSPVLARSGRGVALTHVGRVLLEHAQILLDAEQRACSAVEQARDSAAVELTVGVFCTVAAGLVPRVVKDLAERHPQLQVKTRETDPDEATLQLRHGHLDLAFLIDYPDAAEPWRSGIVITPVGFDALHLAAPSGWFSEQVIDLADLARQDWIMSGIENYYGRALHSACRRAGFDPHIAHQVTEQPTALAMVAAGLGITMMSDLGRSFLPAAGVSTHRLRDPVRRQILVGYDEPARARPAVSIFLDSVLRSASAVGLSRTDSHEPPTKRDPPSQPS
ncbi:MAG: LysR family transcriptional regulator [Humibacillus sp.]|nr:LysR family transcriptional regulator [Humibacillus sp.]MDN5779063.1 LysR family transcriptional regulator [Humibacillus sp.]